MVAIVVLVGRRKQWGLESLATRDGGILVASHPRSLVLLHAALLAAYLLLGSRSSYFGSIIPRLRVDCASR